MTENNTIKMIVDIAKQISDIKPSELATLVPNRELREAILSIFEAGWNEGINFERNRNTIDK